MTVNFISFCNQASSEPRAGKLKNELFKDPIFISSRLIKTNTMARMSAAITLWVSFTKYQTITFRLIRAICMHNFCKKSMSISYSLSPMKLTTYSSLSLSKPGFIFTISSKRSPGHLDGFFQILHLSHMPTSLSISQHFAIHESIHLHSMLTHCSLY